MSHMYPESQNFQPDCKFIRVSLANTFRMAGIRNISVRTYRKDLIDVCKLCFHIYFTGVLNFVAVSSDKYYIISQNANSRQLRGHKSAIKFTSYLTPKSGQLGEILMFSLFVGNVNISWCVNGCRIICLGCFLT